MKMTPLEVRNHLFKRSLRGYDAREVEVFRDLVADAMEDANRDIMRLEEKVKGLEERVADLAANETILKETITTAQRMVQDLKGNAKKEAELIIAEARIQGEEILHQAQRRAKEMQEDIYRLKKQRIELQNSIKAIIDYHSMTVLLGEEEARRADEDAEKLKFLPQGKGPREI